MLWIAQKLPCLTFAFVLGLFTSAWVIIWLIQHQCSKYKDIGTIKQYEINTNKIKTDSKIVMEQVSNTNTANNARGIYCGDHKSYHWI